MAKVLKYKFRTITNRGTETEPNIIETLSDVEMTWNKANEEIAKKEAYNGEYAIEDNGQPEPIVEQTDTERISELEEALALLLSGDTR
jgi:hypothetical protein